MARRVLRFAGMVDPGPFQFQTEVRLIALTGERASTLQELVELGRNVPGSSIFYHTHHMFLAHHFERPVFHNEFALWVGEALQEDELAEKLAAIDLLEHTSVSSVREALIAPMEACIERRGAYARRSPPGDEFHFCRAKSFVIPAGQAAQNPPDLFRVIPDVSPASLFFHLIEARLRLGRPTNDFSAWLEAQGETALAHSIAALNPYLATLDELKEQIVRLGEARFGKNLA